MTKALNAQTVYQPYRLKDQDVERIIRPVEQRSNEFGSSLDSAPDKREYNDACVEYVNTFIERFCDYTKRLRD